MEAKNIRKQKAAPEQKAAPAAGTAGYREVLKSLMGGVRRTRGSGLAELWMDGSTQRSSLLMSTQNTLVQHVIDIANFCSEQLNDFS